MGGTRIPPTFHLILKKFEKSLSLASNQPRASSRPTGTHSTIVTLSNRGQNKILIEKNTPITNPPHSGGKKNCPAPESILPPNSRPTILRGGDHAPPLATVPMAVPFPSQVRVMLRVPSGDPPTDPSWGGGEDVRVETRGEGAGKRGVPRAASPPEGPSQQHPPPGGSNLGQPKQATGWTNLAGWIPPPHHPALVKLWRGMDPRAAEGLRAGSQSAAGIDPWGTLCLTKRLCPPP